MTWSFESRAMRLRLDNWKTAARAAVGSWAISFPIAFIILNGFAVRFPRLPAGYPRYPRGTWKAAIALALAMASGAGGSLQISDSAFFGSGHRIELCGEEGTLVLSNPTADHFRGFRLRDRMGKFAPA
jgi:hypothetical protein